MFSQMFDTSCFSLQQFSMMRQQTMQIYISLEQVILEKLAQLCGQMIEHLSYILKVRVNQNLALHVIQPYSDKIMIYLYFSNKCSGNLQPQNKELDPASCLYMYCQLSHEACMHPTPTKQYFTSTQVYSAENIYMCGHDHHTREIPAGVNWNIAPHKANSVLEIFRNYVSLMLRFQYLHHTYTDTPASIES